MWPDERFAPPRGSFERPAPLPFVEPDAAPNISITVACAWLPYIRGALQQLLLQATWATDDPGLLLQVQQRAFNLIDLFQECSEDLALSCPFDFTVSGGGAGSFVVVTEPSYSPDFFGEFSSGTGWVGTVAFRPDTTLFQTRLEITRHFPVAVTMDAISMSYSFTPGAFEFDPGNANIIQARNGGTVVGEAHVNPRTLAAGNFTLGTAFTASTVTDVDITIVAGEQHGSDAGGNILLADWGYNVPAGGCGF